MRNYIITYDFSKIEIEDNYEELQPKVSNYLNEILGEQIFNNIWYKHWTYEEMIYFKCNCEKDMQKILSKDIFYSNFSLCIFKIHDCWRHPSYIEAEIIRKNLFS